METKRVIKLGDGSQLVHYQQWHNDPARAIADIKDHSNITNQDNIIIGWYGLDLSGLGTGHLPTENVWPEFALAIKASIENLLGVNFNSCQVNRYMNSFVAINWHSDKEQVSKQEPTVAILSLGAYRELLFRPALMGKPSRFSATHQPIKINSKTRSILVSSGDILVMQGLCQQNFEHALKQSSDSNPRYSLVFRNYQL